MRLRVGIILVLVFAGCQATLSRPADPQASNEDVERINRNQQLIAQKVVELEKKMSALADYMQKEKAPEAKP